MRAVVVVLALFLALCSCVLAENKRQQVLQSGIFTKKCRCMGITTAGKVGVRVWDTSVVRGFSCKASCERNLPPHSKLCGTYDYNPATPEQTAAAGSGGNLFQGKGLCKSKLAKTYASTPTTSPPLLSALDRAPTDARMCFSVYDMEALKTIEKPVLLDACREMDKLAKSHGTGTTATTTSGSSSATTQ